VDVLPNIKSAKKRVKVNEAKSQRNQRIKSALKTSLKKFDAAMAEDSGADHEAIYRATVKKIDQAAAKGVIHKNVAARKKSHAAVRLNQLGL
jgi:small subunit ribosomal protein S20